MSVKETNALREAVGRGHCCLPATAWVSATAAVLDRPSLGPRSLTEEEIDRDAIEAGWATLLAQKAVARETFAPPALGSGRPWVQTGGASTMTTPPSVP